MVYRAKLRKYRALYIGMAFIVFATACKEEPVFPDEPVIKLVQDVTTLDINQIGTEVYRTVLTFSFTDGDGDIGLNEVQSEPPYDFNMFVSRIAVKEGVDQEPELLKFRIPALYPGPGQTAIQGELDVQLDIIGLSFTEDTVRYELYILDRELHTSNTITTANIRL